MAPLSTNACKPPSVHLGRNVQKMLNGTLDNL